MSKDYYETLGVGKDASEEDIKRAFRKHAHQWHPDKPGGNAEKFKEYNEAYQTLSDKDKRAKYDQFGHEAYKAGAAGGGPGGFGGFDFSQGFGGPGGIKFDFGDAGGMGGLGDIFGDIFGGAAGGGSHTRTRRESRGRHIEMDLSLTFLEAVFGAERDLEVYKHLPCDTCNGSGAEPGSKVVDCSQCGGSGQIMTVQRTILGNFQSAVTCPKCRGAGRAPEKACRQCGGDGIVKGVKKLSVRIPAGVSDGEVMRVTGEGEPGKRGARSGDLYLNLRVAADPRFTRDGADIRSRFEATIAQAALGGAVSVETVDGEVELKLPAGTQPGQEFRLRGKGVPLLRRSGRGDHLVTVTVAIPKKLTREQRRLLEKWEDL
ncbi:MAG: molecular chaperone DnaJ [Patescibacteria group bacterium]